MPDNSGKSASRNVPNWPGFFQKIPIRDCLSRKVLPKNSMLRLRMGKFPSGCFSRKWNSRRVGYWQKKGIFPENRILNGQNRIPVFFLHIGLVIFKRPDFRVISPADGFQIGHTVRCVVNFVTWGFSG